MADLKTDIAAFERMKRELEVEHLHDWVLFHAGQFIGAYSDFESAATVAVDKYDDRPFLIRQVGADAVQLPGGFIFRPSHALDTGGL